MSITIDRTNYNALVDDTGTGLTGTVWNKHQVQIVLMDPIDAALAKAAQLAGGNTFTGNQTISSPVAGPGNGAILYLNSDVPNHTILASWSSTYTAAGYNLPNGTTFLANGSNGLSIVTAAAPIRVYTSNAERLRIAATGEVIVNAAAPVLACKLSVVADLGVNQGLGVQNINAGNVGTFALFANSAGSVAGSIVQNGATGVTYGTASDHRLKADAGRATDVTALRAVLVHDFTWKADGHRDRGVFAQEAAAVFPAAITEGTDDLTDAGSLARPWMTDYSKFVPDLIVGWQQHDADLAEIRAQLAAVAR